MATHTLGIVIGGLVPAVLYGISNVFIKASNQAGIGAGWYLAMIGITILALGCILLIINPHQMISAKSGIYAVLLGLFWGLGSGSIALAQAKFQTPLSVVIPLFNMNTLVSVLLALWIFAEYKQVKVPQLVLGSLLIVAGGTLVAKS